MEIVQRQAGQFGNPQSRGIQRFEDGFVADTEPLLLRGSVEEALDLLVRQRRRKNFPELGRVHGLGDV